MDKSIIEEALREPTKMYSPNLLTESVLSAFDVYFTTEVGGLCTENIISDESLFRDYSRLGNRKVDFSRVRNPFVLSKYTISSYEKTWYIKDPKTGALNGPHNSYEMDSLFKKGDIDKGTLIGINKDEFFTFESFIEIVYPLPKVKGTPTGPSNVINNVQLQSATKFNRICDESDKLSNKGSAISDNEKTPFKRTPFKVMPNEVIKVQTVIRENYVSMTTDGKFRAASSQKKDHKTMSQSKGMEFVGERYLVKSKKQNKTKFLPQSSKATFKLEMNDIIGNYTAIKRDGDERKYVDYSKKIDFKKGDEEVQLEEIINSADDFDFDDLDIAKEG